MLPKHNDLAQHQTPMPRIPAPAALHVVNLQLAFRKLIEHWVGRLDKTVMTRMMFTYSSLSNFWTSICAFKSSCFLPTH